MSDNTPDQETIDAMTEALAAGNQILAIKIYREATGKGLKESKDFVDALIPKLIERDPQRFDKLQRGGCVGVLLLSSLAGLVLLLTFSLR